MSHTSVYQHDIFRGRVLFVARAPFISGAERALVSMLRHLDRSRVQPMLVLGHETELVRIAAELNIPCRVIAMPKRERRTTLAWWRSLWSLRSVIRSFRPDVMHANDVPSCQAMSALGGNLAVPRVIHVRWVITANDAQWWARSGAESLVCISQWVREQLGDTLPTTLNSATVEVLADCVDWPADRAQPMTPALQVSDDGSLRLGFSGQLIESKGLDLVIAAMGQLPAPQRPRLFIAGEDTQTGGAYKQALRDLAAQSGVGDRIVWLGFVKDVTTLHRAVHAMVCPSRIEPLGLVPLEAARFSIPTLASRVGGLAETIAHEVTGYLAEPRVEAWTEALAWAHDRDRLKRLGAAAHERTAKLYSPMVYQQRLLEIYAQAVSTVKRI